MCNSVVSEKKSIPQLSPVWLDQYWENPEGGPRHTTDGQADRFAHSTVLTVLGATGPKSSTVCA